MAGYAVVKGLLIACELSALWMLSRLVAPAMLMLYAWHPLVLVETAGQAHTESALLLFLVATVWFSRRNQGGWAGATLALAGWTKLYPFFFFPFLILRHGWRPALAGGLLAAALLVPYWHPAFLTNFRESLDLYVRLFEFNAGPYYAVKEFFRLATGEDWSKQLGPAFRVFFILSMAGVYAYDAWKGGPIERRLTSGTIAYLLCSTTVHPWYLVPLLLLAALVGQPAWHWHWLAAWSMGTYLLYVDGPYWPFVIIAWGGAFFMLLYMHRTALVERAFRVLRFRAGRKVRRIQHFFPRKAHPIRVLDLGAAEGYVGDEIGRRIGAEVILADVADLNRTSRPFVRYDGRKLPFEDGSFDAVVLYFVLHHCEEPEAVIREALRVTCGRVIVVESVFRTEAERRRLETLDVWANRVRSLGVLRAQEEHLRFRTAAEWKSIFLASEACLVAEGAWGRMLHRQHLFVLDIRPMPPSTGRSKANLPVPSSFPE
jgi:SAM-dependent methyltransferase